MFLMAALLISMAAYAKSENEQTLTFKVNPALSCGNCEQKIKSNLRFEKGVSAIEAKAPGNIVKVTYDTKKTDAEKLTKAFSKLGYNAEICNDSEEICAPTGCPSGGCPEGGHKHKEKAECNGTCCGEGK